MAAHQDDGAHYNTLLRPIQLNCQADYLAKKAIWGLEGRKPPPQEMLPLEAIGVFAGKHKITSGAGEMLRFWAHRQCLKKVQLMSWS